MATQDTSKFSELLKQAVTEPGIISKAYSAFYTYSLGNQILAMSQCLERDIPIGPIATYKAWQDKGRNVRKGERAIALCMPVTCKGEKVNESGETESYAFSRFVFKNNWFVLSQTDGNEYAQEQRIPAWDKDAAMANLDITECAFEHISGNVQGYARERQIAINPVAALPHKTRFHELAHIVLGHTAESTMSDSERTPRDIREVEAESVAYILCNLLGLNGAVESRGYIQGWLDGQTIPEKSSQRIFSAADKILKAGQSQAVTE